ncbi:hypothetical protein SCP_0505190 [Sparassis crispa]|uniref:Uncharacterized protein n=1 Tax=Sparassis crispa TaxID=139825 RepID=A0A401GMR0_9APHY|nr:hypothetical protein SCP_0505190 [Sparassis crispa]GBE83470.1 hypothetical protein SCP_0505190 [Sparassis crispa]
MEFSSEGFLVQWLRCTHCDQSCHGPHLGVDLLEGLGDEFGVGDVALNAYLALHSVLLPDLLGDFDGILGASIDYGDTRAGASACLRDRSPNSSVASRYNDAFAW